MITSSATTIYHRLFIIIVSFLMMPASLCWAVDDEDDDDILSDSVASDTTNISERPLLLVINSYNETWQGIVDLDPIIKSASEHRLRVNVEHLEIVRMVNDSIYDLLSDALFDKYKDEKPSYVVIAGGMGTTFINRIRQEWGDQIPLVFIGVTDEVGDREDYYTSSDDFVDFSTWQSLDSVYAGANLLYVSQPFFPEKTVDLMVKTVSDLNEVVFVGDNKWINRYLNYRLRNYIKDKYPKLKYNWTLCDSPENREIVNDITYNYKKGRGIIMSTWNYVRPSLLGIPVLVIQDYNSIATSPNPIFALTPMYLKTGVVGGHFYDENILRQNIQSAIDHMVTDEYLDTIPNITVEKSVSVIDYDQYNRRKHAFGAIPDDVVILNAPQSFWDRYQWIIIIVIIVIVALVIVMYIITKDQRAHIRLNNRLENILQGMPVAFMAVDVNLDENKKIKSYSFGKTNERYRSILLENNLAIKKGQFYEDTRKLLLDRVQHAFLAPAVQKTITYTKYFPKSGKTYEWLFKPDTEIDRCYVYGVDISELAASRRNLAAAKSQMEIALLSARLIPWIWDIAEKRLAYDRIRTTKDGSVVSRRGYIDNRRLVSLIHPDDRIKLAKNFNDLASGKIKRWEGDMRIASTASASATYYNTKITALALETDEDGKALTISGAILMENLIDDKHLNNNAETTGARNSQAAAGLAEISKNIIIVEPYESNYILYEAILSNKFTTHRAASADDINSLLNDVVPGVVIINIDTETEEDIINILETVKSRYPKVQIVAITSRATSLNSVKADIRKSFVSVLTLPVTPRSLMGEISRLLHV